MKQVRVAAATLLVLLALGIWFISAQPLASSPPLNSCNPAAVGCLETLTPQPGHQGSGSHPGDEDGDGIPDGIDQCPNAGGPSSNQGCPFMEALPEAIGESGVQAATPTFHDALSSYLPGAEGVCALSTRTAEPVNIRTQPSLDTQVIGTLDPKAVYIPQGEFTLLDGSRWLALSNPYGWVSETAVDISPGCRATLDSYAQHAGNPSALSAPISGFGIKLDKGDSAGQDTDQGYCAPSFALNFSKLDGSGNAIHVSFGDGSVTPNPACIQLDSDGQGFMLAPPCAAAGEADCSKWNVHGAFGSVDGQPTLIATFLPASVNPPDPDKDGFFFLWALEASDPCTTADGSCKSQHGARSFAIDWSQPNATTPGVGFSWSFTPSDPCTPTDTSCTAPGAQTRGVFMNFLPAVQDTNPTPPKIAVYFFPNGFDPSVGGFTQIENQPAGSSPSDKYGFTQIENQPLTQPLMIHFTLPAVQ